MRAILHENELAADFCAHHRGARACGATGAYLDFFQRLSGHHPNRNAYRRGDRANCVTDGRSNWFKGVQLITVYVMMALLFYFTPEAAPR
jgi:hypothetical protein